MRLLQKLVEKILGKPLANLIDENGLPRAVIHEIYLFNKNRNKKRKK